MTETMKKKTCTKCKTEKPLETGFYMKDEAKATMGQCKDCFRQLMRNYYHTHKEEIDYHEMYVAYKERLLAKNLRYRERVKAKKISEGIIPKPRGRPRKIPKKVPTQ